MSGGDDSRRQFLKVFGALGLTGLAGCSRDTASNPPDTETGAPDTKTPLPDTETEFPNTKTGVPDTETEPPNTKAEPPDTETEPPDTETETPKEIPPPYSTKEATFTTPWKKEPAWGHAHVAEGKDYWAARGLPNIDGVAGRGSDTESTNVGTGNTPIGIASLTTAVSVFPATEDRDQLDMSIVGLARGRPLLSLIWRTDMMDDRTDIEGKTILAASGFAAETIKLYPGLVGVNPDNVTFENSGEEGAPPKLARGDVAAVWGSIDMFPVYQEEIDAEIQATPLTAFGGFPGWPIWVNNAWYDRLDDGPEFVSRVLEGYFRAMKWGLLNQSDYLDYLKNNVNPNLLSWTEAELTEQHSVNCAQAVTLDMKNEGLGYYTEEGVQTVLDAAGQALLDDPSTLPSASELIISEPWENTKKVTFTDDEWNTLAGTAGGLWDLFEEAESGY